MKSFIIKVLKGLGDFPVDPHFIPNYNPWEQRFALPQMEIFLELSGRESINSYRSYRSFLTDGILLKSGKALTDIITATGLDLLAFGGVKFNWIRSHLTYLNLLSIRVDVERSS
jgi:cation diffusion facilitator CzcD-associated flavoprotein CzcO